MSHERNSERERPPKQTLREKIEGKRRITAENIPYFIFPIVNFIHKTKPDYIFALDTGARLTGFSVFMLHRELFGILPTQDRRIHFKRIGHSSSYEQVMENLRVDVDRMLATIESPKVLIIDDWINTGKTSGKARKAFAELSRGKIELTIGVMREFLIGGADIKGDTFSIARTTWHHNADQIGVKYDKQSGVPKAVRSQDAIVLRQALIQNVKSFASLVKEGSPQDE